MNKKSNNGHLLIILTISIFALIVYLAESDTGARTLQKVAISLWCIAGILLIVWIAKSIINQIKEYINSRINNLQKQIEELKQKSK
ncbi:MAG: hypothetical protein WC006_05485 [Bacilli bacterium]|nr:hypothetical protein [Bacilli bacterium]